jgi:hypothetical protein
MKTDLAPLSKGLKQGAGMVQTFTAKVEKSGAAMKMLFTGAAAAVATAGIYKVIGAASNLSDAITAAKATFGDSAEFIIDEANKEAVAFGASKRAFIESSTSFGAMLQTAGVSADQAAQLGVAIARTARDLAALKGLRSEEAFTAIGAALRGEFDPAERLGLALKATAVETKALAMGLAKTKEELTDGAKKMATLALISEQGAKAQGFFAANQDRFSSQTEALWGRIENLAAAIGEKLLPVAVQFMEALNVGLAAISAAWQVLGFSAATSTDKMVSGAEQSNLAMTAIRVTIGTIADAWQLVSAAFRAVQANINWGIALWLKGLGAFINMLDRVYEKLTGHKTGAGEFIRAWGEDLERRSNVMWEDVKKDWKKPWAHEAVNQAFTDEVDKMKKMRADLAKEPGLKDLLGGVKLPGAAAATTAAPKFASAMLEGSKEASEAILRTRYGDAAGKPAEETAKNTKQMVTLLGQISNALAQPATAIGNQVGGALAGFF